MAKEKKGHQLDDLKIQAKKDKVEAKRLAKEARKLYQQQKKDRNSTAIKYEKSNELKEKLTSSKIDIDSKKISQETRKKIKVKKNKDQIDKINFKQATREFPIKMIKEVNKIKWSGAGNLTKKYVTVLIFMAVFAIVFFFIDWGLQALFTLMKVI